MNGRQVRDFVTGMAVWLTFWAVVLTILMLTSKTGQGEEPKFTVTNRVPAFVVVNKVAAPTLPTDPNQPAPAGFRWIKYGDTPWKLERIAPGVANPKGSTFPGLRYHSGHDCPECGRSRFIVDAPGPVPNSHVHTCPAGHSWWHRDPGR